jgi:hypothetical protein
MNGVGTKAASGAGTVLLASQIVDVALWAFAVTPPQSIVLAMQGIAGAFLVYATVYWTPHNGTPVEQAPPAEPVP